MFPLLSLIGHFCQMSGNETTSIEIVTYGKVGFIRQALLTNVYLLCRRTLVAWRTRSSAEQISKK